MPYGQTLGKDKFDITSSFYFVPECNSNIPHSVNSNDYHSAVLDKIVIHAIFNRYGA